MKNYSENRFPILIFFIPIFLGLLFTYYYRESRHALTEKLVLSGVLALFDNGMVTRDDIDRYFQTPPTEENPILRALEMTPEDVSGLDTEKPEWLTSAPGQLLVGRIIKHIAIINYLNSQPSSKNQSHIQNEVKLYREDLMIERMEEDLSRVKPIITQEELMDYYINNPSEFHQEGKRLARHIMLIDNSSSPKTGDPFQNTQEQILTRLQSGEDFRKLVASSRSESASNNGLLGWLPKGVLAEEFEKELWSMEVGEIRGPIKIGEMIHFIHLLDEQPQGLLPFQQCREQIQRILEDDKRTVYRYKFLGLPEEIAYSPDPQYTHEYRRALLQAAYARDWDKNMEVVKKTEAFTQYRRAELLFKEAVDKLRQIHHISKESDDAWQYEKETANKLLKKMKFRILIQLDSSQDVQS